MQWLLIVHLSFVDSTWDRSPWAGGKRDSPHGKGLGTDLREKCLTLNRTTKANTLYALGIMPISCVLFGETRAVANIFLPNRPTLSRVEVYAGTLKNRQFLVGVSGGYFLPKTTSRVAYL